MKYDRRFNLDRFELSGTARRFRKSTYRFFVALRFRPFWKGSLGLVQGLPIASHRYDASNFRARATAPEAVLL